MDNGRKYFVFDVPVEDNDNSKRIKESLSTDDDITIKINLFIKDELDKIYYTAKNIGVYITNGVLYFRFLSLVKLNIENLKIKVSNHYSFRYSLIIDLYTEDSIFRWTKILTERKYMKVEHNYHSAHIVAPIEKDGDNIDQYVINNDFIYKSNKIYKYVFPIVNPSIGGGFAVPRKVLQCNIVKQRNMTRIRINIDLNEDNPMVKFVKPYIRSNKICYVEFYSNEKLKDPDKIELREDGSVDQCIYFNIMNLNKDDEIFFWDKSFENKEIETVIDYTPLLLIEPKDEVNIDLIQENNYINLVSDNTSIELDNIISLIKESDVIFLKYTDCVCQNFTELRLEENLVIENNEIKIKTNKEYKADLTILNYKFNKNGFKSLFIESEYKFDKKDESTLSVVQLPDSQYDFVKIGNIPKEVINLYCYGAETIDINLYTSVSLYEYADYNAITQFFDNNLYLVYKKDPKQDQVPEIDFINYKYDENNKLLLILYLKSKLFTENIKNIFTDTAYSTFLGGKNESYIKLPLDKESKNEILNKIINNEKVGIEISFLKSNCACLSYLILNKVAFVSNNEIYIKILSRRDNIVGKRIELKYLPNFGINNTNIKFKSNALSWSDFRIETINEDIKELQLIDLYSMIFGEKYNLMLDKISSGYKYKIRFLSQNNTVCSEEYIINNKNCSIKNKTLYIKLICNPKNPDELIHPSIKNIDNDNYIIEVQTPLQNFQYIYILGTGYSNGKNKEIDINMKNNKVISWDEYFMGVAELSAKRSKDPNRQVGACITKNNVIVGTGYNGFPRGCSDDDFPWMKDSDEITETKFAYVVHAELNAILNSTRRNLNDAVLYVTLFPCTECTKAIIQSGIKKVIYKDLGKHEKEINASLKMFKSSGVEVIKYK